MDISTNIAHAYQDLGAYSNLERYNMYILEISIPNRLRMVHGINWLNQTTASLWNFGTKVRTSGTHFAI